MGPIDLFVKLATARIIYDATICLIDSKLIKFLTMEDLVSIECSELAYIAIKLRTNYKTLTLSNKTDTLSDYAITKKT